MTLLWHGTKVPPDVIRTTGILPVSIEDVLARYEVDADDPRIAEHVTAKRERTHFAYVTGERHTAVYYAQWGSNFEGLVRTELGLPPLDAPGYLYAIDPAACSELRALLVPASAIVAAGRIDHA